MARGRDEAMRATGRDPPGETQVFRVSTGQKVGDVVLLTFLVPIFLVMVGLLVAIPAAVVVYGLKLGASDAERARMMIGAAGAGAIPLSLLALRNQVCWSMTLLADRLRLDAGWLGREVPYDQVRFVRAGELARGRAGKRQAVPLQLELTTRPRRCRIWLPRDKARAALRALHERSDAPALDVDGNELLPKDPERRAAGLARLQRFYRAIGLPLVGLGLVLLGMVASVALEGLRSGDLWSDLGELLEVLAAGVGALVGGLAALRKGRRAWRQRVAGAAPKAIMGSPDRAGRPRERGSGQES